MPSRRGPSLVVPVALALLLASCTAGAEEKSPAAEPTETDPIPGSAVLALGFDQVASPGDVVPGLRNEGSADVAVTVVTGGGGMLTWATGSSGGGAVRTPAYAPSGTVPAAAIVVRASAAGADPFSPGTAAFEFGLDFRADQPSPGRPGDDGDNLLQRGRFGEPTQFKLQLDHGVASCRLAGSAGEVLVKADGPVRSGHWYRISCARGDGQVRMALRDVDAGTERSWIVKDDPGALEFAEVTEPLSVAAKVGAEGELDAESVDQFHGEVDRVFVEIH